MDAAIFFFLIIINKGQDSSKEEEQTTIHQKQEYQGEKEDHQRSRKTLETRKENKKINCPKNNQQPTRLTRPKKLMEPPHQNHQQNKP